MQGTLRSGRKDGLVHELDGRGVTCPCLEQGIGFIQHIVRSIENGLFFLNLPVYRFCLLIVLISGDGKGTESACVNEDLQSGVSPYRYLS